MILFNPSWSALDKASQFLIGISNLDKINEINKICVCSIYCISAYQDKKIQHINKDAKSNDDSKNMLGFRVECLVRV